MEKPKKCPTKVSDSPDKKETLRSEEHLKRAHGAGERGVSLPVGIRHKHLSNSACIIILTAGMGRQKFPTEGLSIV